ncbi:MAG TPA: PspC domain-containing protein [Candidatus Binatia bacterium]|nr:PspC domain-containing protein [Candidatus Binatia bacterium]
MTDRLYRSRTDRVFAGVCGGLAERLNVDPSLIRLAWIILVLLTGVVPFLVLYVVMALVVPERPAGEGVGVPGEPGAASGTGLPPEGAPAARATSGDLAVVLGAGLVIVGVVFLLERWLPIRVDWNLLWPAALVVLGIFLIIQSLRRPAA